MSTEMQTIEHDVLVVGAGGAGLRAAIECGMRGLSTGVVGDINTIGRLTSKS